MSLWRQRRASREVTAVVGLIRGESVHLLRGACEPSTSICEVRGEAILRRDDLDDGTPLLRERLGWEAHEPVYLSGPSPLMVGRAVSVTVPRHEEGEVIIRDAREILHGAQWRAADEVREETATYFGCPLEDVEALDVSIERWKEAVGGVSATLFQVCGPRWEMGDRGLRLPPGLPHASTVVLPLLLAGRVGREDVPEGVLHVEDHLTVLTVRARNTLCHVRSLQCGAAVIQEHIADTLGCSPRESELLMRLAPAGTLAAQNQRSVDRVLRQLLPLWAGMMEVLAGGIPEAERPRRLLVTGFFPTLVTAYFCRPQVLSHGMAGTVLVETLPGAHDDPSGISSVLSAALEQVTRDSAPARRTSRVSPGFLVRS